MCGLVGFVGSNTKAVQKVMSFMLLVDQMRGFDSTGISTIGHNGAVRTFKRAMHATDFLDMQQVGRMLGEYGPNAIIGHNRAATKGVVNQENAHPFTHGDITLAHNGTLRQQSLLPDWKEFEVDSENVCHAINKEGVVATVKKLCGAFALSYYNKKDNTLNLIRNSERTLFYTCSKDGKNMFWASEAWMINVGCAKAGISIHAPEMLTVGQLVSVPVDSYHKGNIEQEVKKKDLTLHVVKTYPKPVGVYASENSGSNIFRNHRFFLETQLITTNKEVITYEYKGQTTCGKFTVELLSKSKVNLDDVYEGVPSSSSFRYGKHALSFSKFWSVAVDTIEQEEYTPVKKH